MKKPLSVVRLSWLEQMPACFSPAELRERFSLSVITAWRLCEDWTGLGRIRPQGRGIYARTGPPRPGMAWAYHRALVANPEGYFTGKCALAHHGLYPHEWNRIDRVTPRRSGPDLEWDGFAVRRHKVDLLRHTCGLAEFADGGRLFRVAVPERVVLDALAFPEAFLTMDELATLARESRKRLRQRLLLQFVLEMGSEAVLRRLKVLADYAGMIRLGGWLKEQGHLKRNMGRTGLVPSLPVPEGTPTLYGVALNASPFREWAESRLRGGAGEPG